MNKKAFIIVAPAPMNIAVAAIILSGTGSTSQILPGACVSIVTISSIIGSPI
jgi:hypothetical protein